MRNGIENWKPARIVSCRAFVFATDRRIGRPIGVSQLHIGIRDLRGLHGCLVIGPSSERLLFNLGQGSSNSRGFERSRDIEAVGGLFDAEQKLELVTRLDQVQLRIVVVRLELGELKVDALEVRLADVARVAPNLVEVAPSCDSCSGYRRRSLARPWPPACW